MINFLLGVFIGITIVNLSVLICMIKTDNEFNGVIIGMGIYYWIICSINFIIRKIKNIIIRNFQTTIVLNYGLTQTELMNNPFKIRFRDWKWNLKKYAINFFQLININDIKYLGRFELSDNKNIIYKKKRKKLDFEKKDIINKILIHIKISNKNLSN